MAVYLRNGQIAGRFTFAFFPGEQAGEKFQLVTTDLVRDYGGEVAPWIQQVLAQRWWPEVLEHRMSPACAAIPIGSVKISSRGTWNWTDSCAAFASKHFPVDLVYAVYKGRKIKAILIIKDRILHVVSPEIAERILSNEHAHRSSIKLETFTVPYGDGKRIVTQIGAEIFHSSDVEASVALDMAENAFCQLYPTVVGEHPPSVNVFPEALGFRRIKRRDGLEFWYRPDRGAMDENMMNWASLPDSRSMQFMCDLAPDNVTVLSPHLVLVEEPDGNFFAVGLIERERSEALSHDTALKTPVPVRINVPPADVPEWLGLVPESELIRRMIEESTPLHA